MTTYVVLLRGVNIGPNRRVSSADLRAGAIEAGLTDVRTYVNSGNLVGTADDGAPQVAHRVATELGALVGSEVPVVALPGDRLARLVAANPFVEAAESAPAHLQLLVGPEPVDEAGVTRLAAEHDGPEQIAVVDGAVLVHYPAGIGRSRLTSARLDRAAGVWTTGRNWRTVTRLLAMTRGEA